MASKMFHKLYSCILVFLPKLYMSILAGCNNKVCPEKEISFLKKEE